jgi:preprotein translocase subunit YajC
MKKNIAMLLTVLFVIVLVFYLINNQKKEENMNEHNNYILRGYIFKINNKDSFILETNDSQYIVFYGNMTELDVNKKVIVTYDGSINESIPPQINATFVDIID